MTNFLNQTRINHKGYSYEVTAFDPSTKRYTVLFPHNKVTKVVSAQTIQKNFVSEQPAHRKSETPLAKREASLYQGIKQRLASFPTYKDVKLDPRWETLKGFRETLHLVEGYALWKGYTGFCLDKDIKGMDAYGPESCVFVSNAVNASQPRKKTKRKSYGIGTKIDVHGQVAIVVGKLPARTIIRFQETGEERIVRTSSISFNTVAKSTKGK